MIEEDIKKKVRDLIKDKKAEYVLFASAQKTGDVNMSDIELVFSGNDMFALTLGIELIAHAMDSVENLPDLSPIVNKLMYAILDKYMKKVEGREDEDEDDDGDEYEKPKKFKYDCMYG